MIQSKTRHMVAGIYNKRIWIETELQHHGIDTLMILKSLVAAYGIGNIAWIDITLKPGQPRITYSQDQIVELLQLDIPKELLK